MDLLRLELRRYKSYKILCQVLNESEKGGESKKSQIKEWERYFKSHKEGNAFIVTEIYNKPKQKNDLRSEGNHSIYKTYLTKLMCDMLLKHKTETDTTYIMLSSCQLFEKLYMVTDEYSTNTEDMSILAKQLNLEKEYISDFYINTFQNFQNLINTALNALKSKFLLDFKTKQLICVYENEQETHRDATVKEWQGLLDCKQASLNRMGDKYKTEKDVIICRQWSKFKKILDEEMANNEDTKHIVYFYKVYEIVFHKKVILEQELLTQVLKDTDNIGLIQQQLNNVLYSSFMTKTIQRHDKAKERVIEKIDILFSNIDEDEMYFIDEDKMISKSGIMYHSDFLVSKSDYVENNEKIAQRLIKR